MPSLVSEILRQGEVLESSVSGSPSPQTAQVHPQAPAVQTSIAQALTGAAESAGADLQPQAVAPTEVPAPSIPAPGGLESASAGPGDGTGEGLPAPAPGAEQGGATEPVPMAPLQGGPVSGGGGAEVPLPPGLERLTGRYEPNQLLEELARALPEVEEGQYRLTLKLHPEHLGEVKLQLQVTGREVYAAMEVANADARQSLESRGDQLRQNLNQAGFDLTGFEVSTGQNRQPQRDPANPFDGLQPGLGWRDKKTNRSAAAAIHRVRNAGSHSGRLDTMA